MGMVLEEVLGSGAGENSELSITTEISEVGLRKNMKVQFWDMLCSKCI